ncbi:MAG TPA: amino acid adenylation domain-containing protein, partial [Longimicrobium sp.]
MWFLERLQPGAALYNIPAALRLRGALDVAALERALGQVVRRHEALRTAFPELDGAPVQVVAPYGGFSLRAEDLSSLDEEEREPEAMRRAAADAARPFDLASGPLFRARLLRLAPDDHVLLLALHHAVGDGWSMGILFREMAALYGASCDGGEPPLADPAVQYADYAVWQRERLRGEAMQRGLAYWTDELAGAPALLELPADRPRPGVESHDGAGVAADLPGALMDRLHALARAEGATPFMVLLAAFQVLLGRWSGSDDVVVGTPAAGRAPREVEDVVGCFVNTLALRTSLAGDPGFREVLRRVRTVTLGAFEHAEVPFEAVVSALQPERSLSHSPLFQVMFSVDAEGPPALHLPGISAAPLPVERTVSRFDLSLLVSPSVAGWRVQAQYRANLFERGTIERMLGHLRRVLEQAAADPDVRISALELMDDAERRLVLEEWNPVTTELPSSARCIHHLVEEQAARTPDAIALVFGDETVTYRELGERANRLAHRLICLGAAPESRVGICLRRGTEMVVAILAVLKAGAAYVPLDPAYPAERLAFMLDDSAASLLVTQEALRGLLPAESVRIVSVDGDADEIAAEPANVPPSGVMADHAAYVIYTSGSTGRPKGVVVTHANVAGFFAAMDEKVGGTVPGTWLAVTRIGFDIHVLELLWTLARGFRVVVHPDLEQGEEDETPARQIRRHGVTHLQCTPSLAEMLIAQDGLDALAGLDRLLLGGEALPADLAARITAVLPGRLVNLYGPTEATVWSTTHEVGKVDGSVPIGRPLANARVYVLDSAFRPQPIGIPGELCIAGAGVARGYLDRPGLTAERFIPDPFSAEPGARLYRTGDRVRWTEVRECESTKVREWDGHADASPSTESTFALSYPRTFAPSHLRTFALQFLGRLDAQVKIRGYRIEPGEIEAALRRHPAVRECAVAVREDAGDRRLAAYVVGAADAAALRAHLRRSLPEHMVPAAFVQLDRLPLTPNGKLDRRALPTPEHVPAADRPPRDAMEARVAQVWREVLGRADVGVRESFFELGGNSLLLYRVYARLRDLRADLRVLDLFRHPT